MRSHCERRAERHDAQLATALRNDLPEGGPFVVRCGSSGATISCRCEAQSMNRRALVIGLGSLLAVPRAAPAQSTSKIPRVGVLWAYSPSVVSAFSEAFRQELRGLGYVEGRNIALEERWAEDRLDRLPSLAAELVKLNVDIIVTASTPAVQAAHQATRTIPI